MAYKKESSSGDITIDVHQGSFCQYAEMQRAESEYLTDLEGSMGKFVFNFIFCTLISLGDLYISILIEFLYPPIDA